jgi:hypothetical protein
MITKTKEGSIVVYRLNDMWHRSSGPAYEFPNGKGFWALFGKRHRYYGPASPYSNIYYLHDRLVK